MEHYFYSIKKIIKENKYNERLSEILIELYRYMKETKWYGACHASASVLYVALKEEGFSPKICTGEVQYKNYLFDHSWIELDNKKIDLAISMTLENGMSVSAPIILDIDIETNKVTEIKYGVMVRGLDDEALTFSSLPFYLYMDMYPYNDKGLWGIVEKVLKREVDIEKMRGKYQTINRQIKM